MVGTGHSNEASPPWLRSSRRLSGCALSGDPPGVYVLATQRERPDDITGQAPWAPHVMVGGCRQHVSEGGPLARSGGPLPAQLSHARFERDPMAPEGPRGTALIRRARKRSVLVSAPVEPEASRNPQAWRNSLAPWSWPTVSRPREHANAHRSRRRHHGCLARSAR
jgi:hypothetical protein